MWTCRPRMAGPSERIWICIVLVGRFCCAAQGTRCDSPPQVPDFHRSQIVDYAKAASTISRPTVVRVYGPSFYPGDQSARVHRIDGQGDLDTPIWFNEFTAGAEAGMGAGPQPDVCASGTHDGAQGCWHGRFNTHLGGRTGALRVDRQMAFPRGKWMNSRACRGVPAAFATWIPAL